MFVFTKKLPDGKFIRSHRTGHLIHEPSIGVCEIAFQTNNYRDALFTEHSIQFPEQLFAAVAKRRSEYQCGRLAAQTLLHEKQIYAQVTQSTDGAPIWPGGWLGSISHTDHCAIAVIAPQNKRCILGIDIENFNPEALDEIAGTIAQQIQKCARAVRRAIINKDDLFFERRRLDFCEYVPDRGPLIVYRNNDR